MELSRHNIFFPLKDLGGKKAVVNLLSQQADVLEESEALLFESGDVSSSAMISEWKDKGYWIDSAEEKKRYNAAYLDFIAKRDKSEVQIFYVMDYSCNFGCSYCYQEGYNEQSAASEEKIDSFFNHIDKQFARRSKYITLFGGEPLLTSEKHRKLLEIFIQKANDRNLSLALVTNGYTLEEYLPLLKTAHIREIQVTLDGNAEIHNSRRPLKGGKATFDNIVRGIDKTLEAGLTVNLRMVVDRENISQLSALADFAASKGWTTKNNFKTQLGRNYELHYCQKDQHKLFSRVELAEALYSEIIKHPQILDFHKPAFSFSKFLFEEGTLPDALFDACTGCKSEWAFDGTGNIYACTATVGKPGEVLGTYWPISKLDNAAVEQWVERDITSIKECRSCSQALACGGGCAAVAKNKNGSILTADCRPIRELASMGLPLYLDIDGK